MSAPGSETLNAEAARVMNVCNACRYCEGYCAVFPAMERRLSFDPATLRYLANLCHGCRSCYHACQYAPPHEFAIDVPRTFAELRVDSYRRYAWPDCVAGLFRRNGLAVALITAASLIGVLALGLLLLEPQTLFAARHGPGAFYQLVPHYLMALPAGAVFSFSLLAIGIGARRFWRDIDAGRAAPGEQRQAAAAAATLRNLGGGGDGCTFPGETPSHGRRWLHQLVLYGFALALVSTSLATLYHYGFGWQAPYGWSSLPVLLGSAGGVAMSLGCAGLLWQRGRATPAAPNAAMDVAFTVLLLLTNLSGLALLVLRESALMGPLLLIHLGLVLALFLVLPYSKFVHGVYRYLGLLKNARESAAS